MKEKSRHDQDPRKRIVSVRGGTIRIGDHVYRGHVEFEVVDISRQGKPSIRVPDTKGPSYVVSAPLEDLSIAKGRTPVVRPRRESASLDQ